MSHHKSNPQTWQVVTNCSSTKRRTGKPIAPAMGYRSLDELCGAWVQKLGKASDLKTVVETYGGRTFTEAVAASQRLGADLHVISAGLGLVHAQHEIPYYNLTVSEGVGSIASWLEEKNKSPADWWASLNNKLGKPYPIVQLTKKSQGVILALPSTYLEMISAELLMLTEHQREKIFIITSFAGQQKIHPDLRPRCLPYDERLDGANEYRGTRNDFPQRALKHLVNEIDFQRLSIRAIQKEVHEFLEKHSKPTLPARAKLDDHQIKQLIQKNWQTYLGKRNSLHRFLRDVALVACEQKRFGALWNQVKQDITRNGVHP